MVVTHGTPACPRPRSSAATGRSSQATLTPKMRQDLRRFQSRAQAIGRPEFAWSAPSSADAAGLDARLSRPRSVRLESSANPGRWRGPRPCVRSMRRCSPAPPPAARSASPPCISTSAPAAMLWALQAYNRLWLLKMADLGPRGAHLAWGAADALRVAHRPRSAARRGRVPGPTTRLWQQRWQPVARCYTSALAVPLTARGLIGLGLNAVFSAPSAPAGSRHASGAHDRLRHAGRHDVMIDDDARGERGCSCTRAELRSSAALRPPYMRWLHVGGASLRLEAALKCRPTQRFGHRTGAEIRSAHRRRLLRTAPSD